MYSCLYPLLSAKHGISVAVSGFPQLTGETGSTYVAFRPQPIDPDLPRLIVTPTAQQACESNQVLGIGKIYGSVEVLWAQLKHSVYYY